MTVRELIAALDGVGDTAPVLIDSEGCAVEIRKVQIQGEGKTRCVFLVADMGEEEDEAAE